MFWPRLKYFVQRSLNKCYNKGILSPSLRRSVVTCLPKGDKPREYLKNWRPISLLSVIYKLASATIANRIKRVLDKIIANTQTGFIPGRYIGESTRLVYDLMHTTEKYNLEGLLMLIDFEKAFDSISWKFMYNVFAYFGFPSDIINWMKLFNNKYESAVTQCGILSHFFQLQRGCKQGDPLACYQFIICGEILSILIKTNTLIKGIIIGETEYKLTQFADDTTLFLNGSRESLLAALNTLEIFGSFSGLKMNTEKTKVVWLGRKKHSKDKIISNIDLEWGCKRFTLLGLEYSVDLLEMDTLNFNKSLNKCKHVLDAWQKRYLTPFGKITIVKTFILSLFTHMFISLPSPSKTFISSLKNILFDFIWDKKPDKISREQLTQNYFKGGLKMVNIDNFNTALKTTWLRKIICGKTSLWLQLLCNEIPNLQYGLTVYGPLWCLNLKSKLSNPFWIDVLEAWYKVTNATEFRTSADIYTAPLWFNSKVMHRSWFFHKWCQNGIRYVNDLLDSNVNGSNICYIQNKEY